MYSIPDTVIEAFPVLRDKTFIRRLASPVPLVPDTTFDIFVTESRNFLALVATDYANPYNQSRELKAISGSYRFEFLCLQKPFGKSGETIDILGNDEMDGNFFVTIPYKNHKLYYYLANLKTGSVS